MVIVMRYLIAALAAAHLVAASQSPAYTIDAIRYATIRDFALSGLVMGAPRDARIDISSQ